MRVMAWLDRHFMSVLVAYSFLASGVLLLMIYLIAQA